MFLISPLSPSHSLSARRNSIICNALSPNSPDWETAALAVKDQYRDPKVVALSSKLEPFTLDLPEIPSRRDPSYDVKVEEFCKIQFSYIKSQYVKAGFGAASAGIIFDPARLGVSEERYPATAAMKLLPKILSRGRTAPLIRASSLRMQEKRDLTQQFHGLSITPAELTEIRRDVQTLGVFRRLFSEHTGTRAYIEGQPLSVKCSDAEHFEKEVCDNCSVLAQICSLTVQDVPLSHAPKEIMAFELNPSIQNRDKLDEALRSFINALIVEYRQDPTNFSLDAKLEK